MSGLKLLRVCAGRYEDANHLVEIEFDGDVWILVIGDSWVTTEHTKRECVAEARRRLDEEAQR